MSTSQAAGLNVVPLLARIVLAAAFIPAGWNKLMSETTFEGEDAALLRTIGAAGTPAQPGGTAGAETGEDRDGKTSALFGPGATGGWSMLAAAPPAAQPPTQAPPQPPAAPPSKSPPEKAPPEKAPSRPGETAPAKPAPASPASPGAPASPAAPAGPAGTGGPAGPGSTQPVGPTLPAPPDGAKPTPSQPPVPAATGGEASEESLPAVIGDPSPLKAASLHHVTLMVHRHGMAYPVYQAYLATAVELLGGALILVGLFSRLWGLGLAGVMAVAFWFTSWPLLAAGNPFGTLFNLPIADFNRMFCQAALFVLAFGVFLTGPGAVSLDRAIFRRAPVE